MSNPRTRGLVIFVVILVVAIVACVMLPFFWLPGAGLGIALPIIEVPGEALSENGWFGGAFVNTMSATLLADAIVLLFAFFAWRASDGWKKEVPGRFQSLVETIVEMLYNFLRGVGGDRLRTTKRPVPLWPLAGTIFLILLAANLTKLVPGFESVGYLHCAHVGTSGYPMVGGSRLWVDAPLNAGVDQTLEAEHACDAYYHGFGEVYPEGFPDESAEQIAANVEEYEARVEELQAAGSESLAEDAQLELEQKEYYVRYAPLRIEALERLEPLNADIEGLDEEIASLEALAGNEPIAGEHAGDEAENDAPEENVGEGEGGVGTEGETAGGAAATDQAEVTAGDEAVTTEPSEEGVSEAGDTEAEPPSSEEQAAQAGDEDADEDIAVLEGEPVSEEQLEAELQEEQAQELATLTTDEQLESVREQRDILITDRNLALSQARYPEATLPLSESQLSQGVVPYIFHITPFLRGAATDLSLTFAYAIMVMVLVQLYGVFAQGWPYFEKFVNISALGNLNKKPLGAIDFVVGLIEIISEIGKIVSLAFRLFGNLFAGGVALLAITFLVSLLLPGIIYGLELIIGTVQALVFAVLTVVFSVQAMEAHHGDEEHEAHEGPDHTGGHGQGEHTHADMPIESTGDEISTGQVAH